MSKRIYFRSIILLLTINFLFAANGLHAQLTLAELENTIRSQTGSISSIAATPSGDTVIVSIKNGTWGHVLVISLKDCMETRRYNYTSPVNLVSVTDSSGDMWVSSGNSLMRVSIMSGQVSYSENILEESVKGISADNSGNYVAVWGNSKLYLLSVGNSGVTPLWSTQVNFIISGVALDMGNKVVYISGYDGTFAKVAMSGESPGFFDLQSPIKSIAIDEGRRYIFMGMQSGLIRYDISTSVFVRVTDVPVEKLFVNARTGRVSTFGRGMYSVYSYPASQLLKSKGLKGDLISVLKDGSAVTGEGNVLYLYSYSTNEIAGRMFVYDNGFGVISPANAYYGNEAFIDTVSFGKISDMPQSALSSVPDQDRACYYIRQMIGEEAKTTVAAKGDVAKPGVTGPDTASVTKPFVTGTEQGKTVASAQTGSVSINRPNVTKPDTPLVTRPSMSDVTLTGKPAADTVSDLMSGNIKPDLVSSLDNVSVSVPNSGLSLNPVFPDTKDGGVPNWINNENLTDYSAVRSGADSAEAMKAARIKIRDDVARAVIKKMLGLEYVKQMNNDELKKRFLWMVGARTGKIASEYAMQKDYWVSPDKKVYVLAQISADSVEQIYGPIFQEEMDRLSTYGTMEYLKQEPVKWE